MRNRTMWLRGAFSVLLAAGVFGCGGSDDGGGGADAGVAAAPAADEGQTVTVPIAAAAGGEVSSPSGSGKLTIPPGALAADTEIVLNVGPAAGGSAASVYDFGPDGTQFSVPATLTLKFDAAVPEGKKAVMAVMTDGAWAEIPGSALAGGSVTGAVSHFSRFTVILVDGQAQLSSDCADVAESFVACGGDPTGVWDLEDVCAASQAIGQDPFNGQCPGASLTADITVEGTITFGDGQIVPQTTRTGDIALHVPKACLQGQPCAAVTGDDPEWTCQESDAACDCTKTDSSADDESDISAYSVEGTNLVVQDGDTPKNMPFCVEGDTLKVAVESDETGKPSVIYVAKRH